MMDANGLVRRKVLAVTALVATLALPLAVNAQALDAATAKALDASLAGPQRSERNRARDRHRHPKESLAFFGLRRDMTVVEIWPGGGWYTEILAPVLKGSGTLYAAQYGPRATFDYQKKEDAELARRAQASPDVFGEVKFTSLWSPQDLAIAPPGSADLVLTFRNVHNWVDPGYKQDPAKLFGAFFAALKPGGILGVVDHRWPDAKSEDPAARNGYISEERVKGFAKTAGFEFVASSDVNRNPKDTHDHPNGVWSLPPDVSAQSATDREKYLAIGESDRMTLKFRKPASR
jgi:predicted methyltransferase